MKKLANHAASEDGGIEVRFHAGRAAPAAPEPRRSPG